MMRDELQKIADKNSVSVVFLYKLLSEKERRYTLNKNIAVALAKIKGGKPIDFISPGVREAYKRAWPELNKTA